MTRTRLLANLRGRLGVRSDDETRLQTVTDRLASHPRNTLPMRANLDQAGLVDLFEYHITRVQGTVGRVGSLSDVTGHLSNYLKTISDAELETVSMSPDAAALGLDFSAEPHITISDWTLKTSLSVCLSTCFGAVAETGSLVVCATSGNALSQNFLSDTHIVILMAADLMPHYEDVWDKVRAASPQTNADKRPYPRDLTFVSGPSCTGDIEMIMEYGAHGPKRLHTIIVGADA